MRISRVLLGLSLAVGTSAFTSPGCPQSSSTHRSNSNSALQSVIKAGDNDFGLDSGAGGVGLAMESVIKVTGDVKHKPGSANPKPSELLRYDQMQEVSEAQVNNAIQSIICTGRGKELFTDPGSSVNKEVTYAPLDAVRDAMMAAGSTQDAQKLVINFLGGDDLQIMEILRAVEQLVLNLDVKTSTSISFNSASYTSFPAEQATLTLVALGSNSNNDDGLSGAEKSLAAGEVYFQDGKYFTVAKEDINAAVA